MKLLYRDTGDLCASIGLLAVRLVVGVAFLFHGWPKIQNPMGWMGEKAPVPGLLQAAAAGFLVGWGARIRRVPRADRLAR